MSFLRAGICVLAAFAVLAHGAVEPWSQGVLEIGAAILLLVWAMVTLTGEPPKIVWNPLLWPLLAFWAVATFQLATGATAVAFLTRIDLLQYSALVALFFLCAQCYRTRAQWRNFVWFLLSLGFAVSLFAILQHFTFNGKLYWLRELQYGGIPFGPFVNRNHYAGLMELLIPPGLAIQLLGAERRDQLPLVTLFTLIPIGSLFLSASRGGIISFVVEVIFLTILIIVRRREKTTLVAGSLVITLAAILISWLGIGGALDRFANYKKLETSEGRRVEMLHDSLRIFYDHRVLGTGLGTLQEVFPVYETYYDGLVVNHSHNDYAETLAETGAVGGLCGLVFLVLLFWNSGKILNSEGDLRNFSFHAGALVACLGLLVHGGVDFNFHIPSNLLIFLLQAALATSAFPTQSTSRRN
ncbi:MAG TPA: O-antigen ligase family protein [Candidatus Acidoferrales bacterium]|jgi:O-antigen ligase|nr:O-antigen ligase family protein [Candidatus Acidoferrales bacterium]